MSPDTKPTTRAQAESRFNTARAALRGMQVDLSILASRALDGIHRRNDNPHPDIVVKRVPDLFGSTREVAEGVPVWHIPDTAYYLPEWRRQDGTGVMSMECTLIAVEQDGTLKVITFDHFVLHCQRLEYVAVCYGLCELAQCA